MAQISRKYIVIGRIKDAHSLKGEVFVRLAASKADWLDKLDHVQLKRENGGDRIVKSIKVLAKRPHKNGLILVLEGITDRTAAEAMKGYDVQIPEDYLVAEPGESIYLRQVLGFKVIDSKLGPVGAIASFATNGAQDLLVVPVGQKEHLIPFVQDFIETIDFDAREVRMHLPEGLIETDPKGIINAV